MSRDLYSVKSNEGAMAIADDISSTVKSATRSEGSVISSVASGLMHLHPVTTAAKYITDFAVSSLTAYTDSDLRLKKAEQDQDYRKYALEKTREMNKDRFDHELKMSQLALVKDVAKYRHDEGMLQIQKEMNNGGLDHERKMGQLALDMKDENDKHVAGMLQMQQAMKTHRHEHEHAMGQLTIAMKKEKDDHVQNLRQLAIVMQRADSKHVEKMGQLERAIKDEQYEHEHKMGQLAIENERRRRDHVRRMAHLQKESEIDRMQHDYRMSQLMQDKMWECPLDYCKALFLNKEDLADHLRMFHRCNNT